MNCPFCQNVVNEGAIVCHHCGASYVESRREGLVTFVALGIPLAFFVVNHALFKSSGGGPRASDLAVVVVCFIVAALLPKHKRWVRRVG